MFTLLRFRYYIFTILFFLCSNVSLAQRFPFFNLKVENGLVQSQATCLAQDKFGNLWIGTLGGLSRYDGKKIKNYTVSDGLISNNIVDVQFISSGTLLISTGKSLQSFDGKQFTTITNEKNQQAAAITHICQTGKGVIFCLQKKRLCIIDLSKNKIREADTNELFNTLLFSNQKLYAASEKGNIYELKETDLSQKTCLALNNHSGLSVIKMYEDQKHNFWILSNEGLYLLQDKVIKPFVLDGKKAISIPVLSASEDKNGQIWFASYIGAFRLKDSVISYFNQQNGLSNNVIFETLCDKEGNIWLSTDGEGVFRYSGGPFISLDENFGLPNKQVTGIAGSQSGEIYFSSYQGRLSSYNLGSSLKVMNVPQIERDVITSLHYQHGKGLWVGTRSSGLYFYADNRFQKINYERIAPQSDNVTSLYSDSSRLFIGLSKDMLCRSGEETKLFSLGGASPICFTRIGHDSIIIATGNGFFLFNQNIISQWKPQAIFDSIVAQCMVMQDKTLYIGTTEKGIIAFDFVSKLYQKFNSKNGLSSDFIYNMVKDDSGNIWAGTGMGICKIDREEGKKEKITIYGKANGIIGLESNSNAAYVDNAGHVWFGTTEGVSCFFPTAKPTKAHPVSIVLESVKLFGGKNIDTDFYKRSTGWYNIPEGLNLPYRFNNISFAFQAITLSPLDKIFYRYILEGSSTNWSEWSEENTINFSALEPGNYTLKVICKINNQVQEQVSLKYSFCITTPFHKSIWFVISIIGLAVLLGVYMQYAANKRKQRRLKREEALRKEEQSRVRERTAEDFHDEVGNKLTRINVLTSVLKSKISAINPDAERIIQQIQDNSQQLYAGTRDILWSLQPSNDNLYEILNHVSDLANELFSETNINFTLSGNNEILREYKMPLDKSRNFIMIWKEALNNCMKYAEPKNVLLQVQYLSDNAIQIRLVDDGKGFDSMTTPQGNGLKNMKTRALRLGATLDVLSTPDKGTQVLLNLPEIK